MSLVGVIFMLVNVAYVCHFKLNDRLAADQCKALCGLGGPAFRQESRHGHGFLQRGIRQ